MKNYEIITTGDEWIGYGNKTVYYSLKQIINDSKENIILTIYLINNIEVVNLLKNALDRGIKVEIYVFKEDEQKSKNIIDELNEIKNNYKYFYLYNVEKGVLHAKIVVSDDKKVILGSANLTLGGLLSNYEMGLYFEDEKIANNIINLLRRIG